MAIATAIAAAAIGAAGAIGGSAIAAGSANKQAKRARNREKTLSAELNALENSRGEVINPYEGVTDLSAMVSDLSSIANNPFNSLSVSTAASEMQAEQTDLALANTLDTLRATGASAGGATALARMALESKKGISANIEQQEVNNQKLRAQGEQNLQAIKLSEAQRVQGALYGEAGRMQQADVSGKEFVYSEEERRKTEQLNRKQAQITGQAQAATQARQNQASAMGAGISAVGNIASSFVSNYQIPTNPQVSSVNAGIPTYGSSVNNQIKTSAGAIPQYTG
jgi:hypothetical protein